jgi:hypothetical protein
MEKRTRAVHIWSRDADCGTHAVLDASTKDIPVNSNINGALPVNHRNSMLDFHPLDDSELVTIPRLRQVNG